MPLFIYPLTLHLLTTRATPCLMHSADQYRYTDHCRTPLTTDPLRRLKGEAYCLSRVFVPYAGNDNTRKFATILVVGVWASLELLSATQNATLPEQFYLLRLFVGILIGRMWGIQFNNIAGMEFSYDDGDDSE